MPTINSATTVANIAAITGMAAGDIAILSASRRSGTFVWTLGNYSSSAAVDTTNGIFIASSSVAVTTGCWVRAFSGPIQADWFGMVPDGTTVNDTSLMALQDTAANWADLTQAAHLSAKMEFSAGTYIVTQNGLFSRGLNRLGVAYTGSGSPSTTFQFQNGLSGERWFFDNGDVQSLIGPIFENMRFAGCSEDYYNSQVASLTPSLGAAAAQKAAIPVQKHGFRVTAKSAGPFEQAFRFLNCSFVLFTYGFDLVGTNLASEFHFWGCAFRWIGEAAYRIRNQQSFNHTFHGCDWELLYGDGILLETGSDGRGTIAGGSVTLDGGSVIMSDDGTTTPRYLYRVNQAVGISGTPSVLENLRVEFNRRANGLCYMADGVSHELYVRGCNIHLAQSSVAAEFVAVGRYGRCYIEDSDFYPFQSGAGFGFHVLGTAGGSVFNAGEIIVTNSRVPTRFSDNIVVDYFGRVSGRGLKSTDDAGSNAYFAEALDFDYNWSQTAGFAATFPTAGSTISALGGQIGSANFFVKTAFMKPRYTTSRPGSNNTATGNEHQLLLPRNAIVIEIHQIIPPGTDGVTPAMTWKVGTNDKAVTLSTTNAAVPNVLHAAHDRDIYYHVGSNDNQRILRWWASSAVTDNVGGGLIWVAYI